MTGGPLRIALLLLVLAAGASAAAPGPSFRTYANDRFAYSLQIPADFVEGPQPGFDDGRTFTSPSDGGRLVVYGAFNVLSEEPAAVEAARKKRYASRGAVLDYRAAKRDWFVLSGTVQGQVFYEKVVFSKDREKLVTLVLTYPVSVKQRYDAIVTKASRSLRLE